MRTSLPSRLETGVVSTIATFYSFLKNNNSFVGLTSRTLRLTLGLLLVGYTAMAWEIKGKVTCTGSGTPVSGAQIRAKVSGNYIPLTDPTNGTTVTYVQTDALGNYDLEPGTYDGQYNVVDLVVIYGGTTFAGLPNSSGISIGTSGNNLAITCGCSCISKNFLVNSDFSVGDPPSSWVVANGTSASAWSLGTGSSTGNFGVLNNSDDNNSNYYIEQYASAVAGQTYTLNALAATHNYSLPRIAQIYFEFYNGSTLLATSAKTSVTHVYDGNLQAISPVSLLAPANTNKVRIVGYSKGRALKLDDVKLTTCYTALTLLEASKTNPVCGQNNGSVTVTASGGSGSFEYSKNGSTYQASPTFSGLGGTSYTIYVRDKNSVWRKGLLRSYSSNDKGELVL